MASETETVTPEAPSEPKAVGFRELWAKAMEKSDRDLAFMSLKYVGTIAGPKKYIPKAWQAYRKMNSDEYEEYLKKVTESEGFDVTGCEGKRLCGGIAEARYDQKYYGIDAARFAVKEHNKAHGTKLSYVKHVRVNYQGVGGMMYYVTFKAVDKQDNNRIKVYRTKVFRGAHAPSMCLKFLVLAPEEEQQEETAEKPRKRRRLSPRKKPTRPFNIFVAKLRKTREFKITPYNEVLKVAGIKWRAMSAEEKACYNVFR